MHFFGRAVLVSVFFSFILTFPVSAFTPEPGTDDPPAFFSCFYLGNIVDDTSSVDADIHETNKVTFHDGRAIQLYAMGKLTEGHSKTYIEAHLGKIADFARAIPTVSESGGIPDWYDGRVASLTGILFCAADDADGDGLSDTLPRATCPVGTSSLYPEGSVIERIKQYLRPCCVLSGETADETVDFFPCALQ